MFKIYLKIEVSKIIWKLEYWELGIRISGIKFEGNWNFGIWKLSSEIRVFGEKKCLKMEF